MLRWYILNCHRNPTNYDAVSVRKESRNSSRKIDGAITAILAFGARQEYMMTNRYRQGKGGAIRVVAEATQIEITLDEALQELDGQTLKFPESEQYYNAEKR